jgi:trehalose 6-phosphate synthase
MIIESPDVDINTHCGRETEALLKGRPLIIVSNRGPFSFSLSENEEVQISRSSGGLVTALLGLAQNIDITWVASAITDLEKQWGRGQLALDEGGHPIDLHLVPLSQEVYDGYYHVISNPLLWFLQHSMWNMVSGPTITHATWQAWNEGYVIANRAFAQVVAQHVQAAKERSLVMIQDYHLYLMPRMMRSLLHSARRSDQVTLTHFIHIPWPGPDQFRVLPPQMRLAILEGLTAVDVLGFQTTDDCFHLMQSVAAYLPGSFVSYKKSSIWFRNHATIIRDFPISIDVPAVKNIAASAETLELRQGLERITGREQVIVRVDRTEPSKNIVRGFQAYEELLELHPEHIGKVKFLAFLVPSRLDVDEYRDYHDRLLAAAGWINSRFGTSDWEPVRVILGENYPRALAGLQIYDVLLVNSIADGMNLVAKEGSIINQKNGVLLLSEGTGASQQLESGALIISPCDVYGTAEALHRALTMPAEERQIRAQRLRKLVQENDINAWFCSQINEIVRLGY